MNHLECYVFRNMQFDRKYQHFANNNEMESHVQQFMATKLSREVERLKDNLNNIIDVDGAYL